MRTSISNVVLCLAVCLKSLLILVSPKRIKISSYSFEENDDSGSSEEIKHKNLRLFDLSGQFRSKFALEVIQNRKDESVVCSPLSALLPLAKLALGAEGNAKVELFTSIGVLDKTQLKEKYQKLLKRLKHLPGVKLNIASRIFASDKVHVHNKYKSKTEKIFSSSVVQVNYDNIKETTNIITTWVAKHSGESNRVKLKIKMKGIKSTFIINIITFEGDWESRFHDTGKQDFYSPKKVISVPMMYQRGYFKYVKSNILKSEVIEIPYKKEKASFIVILPFSKTGLRDLVDQLRLVPERLNDATKEMTSRQVILTLPKFKIKSKEDLKPIYKSVGLYHIFSNKTGLTKIIKDSEMTISEVFQITVIDVNERGTHAAAVTGVEMIMVSLDLERVIFTANRPFLFYIKSENEQLFAGAYFG